jgi:hypothetical protein
VSSVVLRRLPLHYCSGKSGTTVTLLKPNGYFTFHEVQHSNILHSAHRVSVCVFIDLGTNSDYFAIQQRLVFIKEGVVSFRSSQCDICDVPCGSGKGFFVSHHYTPSAPNSSSSSCSFLKDKGAKPWNLFKKCSFGKRRALEECSHTAVFKVFKRINAEAIRKY